MCVNFLFSVFCIFIVPLYLEILLSPVQNLLKRVGERKHTVGIILFHVDGDEPLKTTTPRTKKKKKKKVRLSEIITSSDSVFEEGFYLMLYRCKI